MSMAIIEGKYKICETPLSEWSPEKVSGFEFYNRYQDFCNIFKKYITGVDFEKYFAQPVCTKGTIEWFVPISFKNAYNAEDNVGEKERIISIIKKGLESLKANEHAKEYIDIVLRSLETKYIDDVTYLSDNDIMFCVWGLIQRNSKPIKDIISFDVSDRRIHKIKYKTQGQGSISFSEKNILHGHTIEENQIPELKPCEGYKFKEWLEQSPVGIKVNKNITFTAVFEKDNIENGIGEVDAPGGNGIEGGKGKDLPLVDAEDDKTFWVNFTSDENGSLIGETTYTKKKGEKISEHEIPNPLAKEGFRFVRWDKNPINHKVAEDVEFRAQYEPINHEPIPVPWYRRTDWFSGCLNWLLALLLLLLILFLLWFLLGKHDFSFCGCNCEQSPYNPTPAQTRCDDLVVAGSNEPQSHIFDMGKQSGTFDFEYATGGSIADSIVIYDGNNRNSKIIFNYYGTTGDCSLNARAESKKLSFSNRYILVDIFPDTDDGTCWQIKVNCPN